MSKATAEQVEQTEETNIALLMESNPGIVITEPKALALLYEHIDNKIMLQVPDLTTDKGRKAIASLAHTIARTKTAVEGAAKKMTEEYRRLTGEVNTKRNEVVAKLQEKQDLARRPLDEWEKAEDDRIQRVADDIAAFKANASVHAGESSGEIAERLADVERQEIEQEVFQDRFDEAVAFKAQAIAILKDGHARALKQEADSIELARLREESDRRAEEDRKRGRAEQVLEYIKQVRMGFLGVLPQPFGILLHELETKIIPEEHDEPYRERIEFARQEAYEYLSEAMQKQGEEKRQREQQEAQLRAEQAAEEAKRNAIEEEQRKAQDALDKQARDHQAELDRIEADRQREIKLEEARQKHADEQKRIATEAEERRKRNRAHQAAILGAAKDALMVACELDEPTAKAVIMAIYTHKIPSVKVEF